MTNQGESLTTSSTYRQCLTASYRSDSLVTVFPLYFKVLASLHTETFEMIVLQIESTRIHFASKTRRTTNDEVSAWKGAFRLSELIRVSIMKQIVNAIGVDPHRTTGYSTMRHEIINYA